MTGVFDMAMDFSTRASAVTHIMLFGLLASGARAEPMLRVPDYVTDHGGWPIDVIR